MANSYCASWSFASALARHLTAALQKVHQLPGWNSPSPLKASSALGLSVFSVHSISASTGIDQVLTFSRRG